MMKRVIIACCLCFIQDISAQSKAYTVTDDIQGLSNTTNDNSNRQTNKNTCLIGHMTDVQTWVDKNGNLSPYIGQNSAIDVSLMRVSVNTLMRELRNLVEQFSDKFQGYIRYLSMASCNLKMVPMIFNFKDRRGRPLHTTVEYLTLYGNYFVEMSVPNEDYGVIINATNVEPINLNFRTEYSSWAFGFNSVMFYKLKELDLRRCNIQQLNNNIFENMPYLEALYLGENAITHLRADTFYGLRNLLHLDLSNNLEGTNNQILKFEDENVFSVLHKLISLDLSNTIIQQHDVNVIKSLSRKLQSLSLCFTGITSLPSSVFNGTSLKYLDISGNSGILSGNKPLAGLEEKLEVLYAKQIGLKTFQIFHNFSKINILNVSSNEISSVSPNVLDSMNELIVLNLDKNRLTSWFTELFGGTKLKFLSLRYNNLNLISRDMVVDFENIDFIGLSGNSLVCNCQAREFFEIAYRNQNQTKDYTISTELESVSNYVFHTGFQDTNTIISQRQDIIRICGENNCTIDDLNLENDGNFILFDYDVDDYSCLLMTEARTVPFFEVRTCIQPKRDTIIEDVIQESWIKLLFLLLIPTIILPVLVFCYIFRRNLRYFCITIRNSATLSLINKDTFINDDTIFNYDVFVSYCHDDRNWVLDHFLPHVEKDCNVSVCLHERDFQVGLSILENIVSCMDRSRCIMLVISPQFLLSQWCQFEMHLAQHRLLETRREDLILVLLEDVPRRVRPTTLHYLMLTKTYIVWPKEESDHHAFWKRLIRRLMVHSLRLQENVSLA